MAWELRNVWDGESGTRDVWVNTETGEQSNIDPRPQYANPGGSQMFTTQGELGPSVRFQGSDGKSYNFDVDTAARVWDSTPGSIEAKLEAASQQTGAGAANIIPWAQASGRATNEQLRATGQAVALHQAGYPMAADGQLLDQNQGDELSKALKNYIIPAGLIAGSLYTGGMTLAPYIGGAGAAGAAGAGADAAAAAGATGGAAGAAGGGLTLAEAAGVTAGGLGSAAAGGTGAAALGPSEIAMEGSAMLGPSEIGMEGGAIGSAAGGGAGGGAGLASSGGAAGAAAGLGGSELARILGGTILPAALGAYASNRQSQSLEDLANQYMGLGAPSRARYESSFAPGFTMESDPGYKDALDQTTKSFLHKASISGNPAGSPNAWTQTLKDVNSTFAYPALQDYRKLAANAGGLSRFADAAPAAATGAIGAQRGVYDAIGYGAANIFNPPSTLEQLARAYRYG